MFIMQMIHNHIFLHSVNAFLKNYISKHKHNPSGKLSPSLQGRLEETECRTRGRLPYIIIFATWHLSFFWSLQKKTHLMRSFQSCCSSKNRLNGGLRRFHRCTPPKTCCISSFMSQTLVICIYSAHVTCRCWLKRQTQISTTTSVWDESS